MKRSGKALPTRQRGAVLVMSMMMLLILTLIGVTAMQLSARQEKMAGNTRDLDLALQAAEAALRFGESRLVLPTLPNPGAQAGWYYRPVATLRAPALHRPTDWSGVTAITFPVNNDYWDVAQSPSLVIEDLGPMQNPDGSIDGSGTGDFIQAYRVTSRAVGGVASTNVILQSTFQRR